MSVLRSSKVAHWVMTFRRAEAAERAAPILPRRLLVSMVMRVDRSRAGLVGIELLRMDLVQSIPWGVGAQSDMSG